jgi:hypothetical protein
MESVVRTSMNDTLHFLVEHYPNVGFTKFKVQRVVNLFEDTGSVRELNYLTKISRSCFSKAVSILTGRDTDFRKWSVEWPTNV